MITYKTFAPGETKPTNYILPQQKHTNRIVKIKTGNEELTACDGVWTSDEKFLLAVRTADCAPIVFIGKNRFGVLHAGWRGLELGIIEKMLAVFAEESPKIYIGPLYPKFEIQRDDCYQRLVAKCSTDCFTTENGKLLFHFLKAIRIVIPQADFCGESTFANKKYASWRRDKHFKNGENYTIVGNIDL
jgi:copper oxidase (laccase) domain-containing protein